MIISGDHKAVLRGCIGDGITTMPTAPESMKPGAFTLLCGYLRVDSSKDRRHTGTQACPVVSVAVVTVGDSGIGNRIADR
ncbi:hypothetical protein [Saccharothrix deserti]|uniref:hypothetical protein n=1 Tax=Saccharothrix deserti TaxID=2593674 RepID=UPI00131D4BA4|nr:hypothetical protein [Saccharothrix deserti]